MSSPNTPSLSFESRKKIILIVDDTPANLGSLMDFLKSYGYKTLIASNGHTALKRAQYIHPDLILLDIMMPGMNGIETCRRLKSHETTRDIPVIFMTALTSTEDKLKGFEAGGVDYVTKPIQHKEVLARVATHLHIRELTENLEQTNKELLQTLDTLKTTHQRLIVSEKMAALNELVVGVAHEMNTPIGVGITASSALEEETQILLECYEKGQMKPSVLQSYLKLAMQSSRLILKSFVRVADLVRSFKQIAVDHIGMELRVFHVKRHIEDTLLSVIPQNKRELYPVDITGDETIAISSHPGAFSQVISHLVMNSMIHAFQESQAGCSCFDLKREQEMLVMTYSDTGCGIPAEHLNKIFDPFFTTARGQKRIGLGLYIVYNLVTQTLKGTIRCESQQGAGTTFILHIPLNSSQKEEKA